MINSKRQQDYANLISDLLRYRSPQGTNQILNANRGWVNAWLVLTMAESEAVSKEM
jgi:hypothetical protein